MDKMFMCTIVTTNVIAAAMQRTDMTYLGGTLRRIKNRMSSKRRKAKAEELLRNYMLQKYRDIKLSVVDKSKVTRLIKKYSKYINQRRS